MWRSGSHARLPQAPPAGQRLTATADRTKQADVHVVALEDQPRVVPGKTSAIWSLANFLIAFAARAAASASLTSGKLITETYISRIGRYRSTPSS
jgi:hypothetical protein